MSHSISDIKVSSIAFGFTLGFGFLTTWNAIKQTNRSRNPWKSAYIYMIWGELLANVAITIQAYLYLSGVAQFTLPYAFILLSLWVFELQLLMQIIINRVSIVMSNKKKAARIKWGTALAVTFVNITVFCIWIPAKLQVSERYIAINAVWDRIEKIIILLIDAALNWYFIRVVKARLVSQGLTKYDKLVQFNVKIVMVSLTMDALIIGLMSLKNGAVYIQLHPLAYTVKLNIEMSMADLITKIARDKQDIELSSSSAHHGGGTLASNHTKPSIIIHTQKDVIVQSTVGELDEDNHSQGSRGGDNDERPLKDSTWGNGRNEVAVTASYPPGYHESSNPERQIPV
ncbi:uncharacterized protein H6S33_003699 [Morchella sextelata]|uniref:uncharacterized protein n=1 Tax=Morchella sextelata TaxID=1174677 RepID=UPI001D03FFDD|nr:uncharacterized protein H6S33_003699 [Morchella sextelata]KAH0606865.1 hypothetical protein H6S33_003699 [Morchella sextelata]